MVMQCGFRQLGYLKNFLASDLAHLNTKSYCMSADIRLQLLKRISFLIHIRVVHRRAGDLSPAPAEVK